jgi:transposase
MHIIQSPLFDFEAYITSRESSRLVKILEALPSEKLILTLEREHWTGRKGYAIRGMWSAFVAGLLYNCHSLAEVVRLLKRDKETRLVCGFSRDNLPGEDAMSRFLQKLVKQEALLEECFDKLTNSLHELLPGFGSKIAVDSTEIKAYAKGNRSKPADPDARWGAKGTVSNKSEIEEKAGVESKKKQGKKHDIHYWFGYKLHLAVDAIYELPVSFTLTPANEADTLQMETLLKKAKADKEETRPQVVVADKGYDSQDNNKFIYKECQAMPIIPIREWKEVELPDICNAKGTPFCGCGLEMTYWGRDGKYLKYRCPQVMGKGECKSRFPCTSSPYGYVLKLPIEANIRLHPPVPRESRKWRRLYKMRTAVERVNSRVKDLLGLNGITMRGIAKVTVRAACSLLIMLAIGLSMAKEHNFAELRSIVT